MVLVNLVEGHILDGKELRDSTLFKTFNSALSNFREIFEVTGVLTWSGFTVLGGSRGVISRICLLR